MSVKRQATTELNHENWDDEDPSDDKNMGQFRAAPQEVLEKRVIRTARRRNPISTEPSKSVFSGFGGFNKTQKTSFDFLANLTNGNKPTNGSTTTSSSESTTSSGLFSSKPATSTGSLFGSQSSSPPANTSQTITWSSPFGSSSKTPSTLFSTTNTDYALKNTPVSQAAQSLTSSKPTSSTTDVFGVPSSSTNENKSSLTTISSPFKIQPTSSTTTATVQTSFGTTAPAVPTITPEKKPDDKPNENKIKYFSKLKALNEAVSDWINKHVAQTPLCILTPIFNDYEKYLKEISEEYHKNKEKVEKESESTKSLFGLNTTGSSPFTNSKETKTTPFSINNALSSTSTNQDKISSSYTFTNTNSFKTQDTKSTASESKTSGLFAFTSTPKQDNKTSSIFGVNNTESKQEPNATPFSLSAGLPTTKGDDTKKSALFGITNNSNQDNKISTPLTMNSTGSSMFASPKNSEATTNSPFALNAGSPLSSTTIKSSPFGTQNNSQTSENKQPNFSFGIKPTTSDSSVSKPGTGFSFGVTPSVSSASSPFSSITSTTQSTTAQFSFGTGKPFSFSTNNVQQAGGESKASEENEDEEPPKVEYTPVQEENSVYEKKCKVFVKKDSNFVDKGVGTLYIKKIEGNVKHQLLVRANTNLGTVLLNLVLAEAIPIQRMGKNNVMMVCIPTPDSNPPPTPILIRVKTGEEADELLQTLNKYKA